MNLDKSVYNITTTPLPAGGEWVGGWEFMDKPSVAVSAKTDKAAIVYFEFSNDQVNVDVFPTLGYSLVPDVHLFRSAVTASITTRDNL